MTCGHKPDVDLADAQALALQQIGGRFEQVDGRVEAQRGGQRPNSAVERDDRFVTSER